MTDLQQPSSTPSALGLRWTIGGMIGGTIGAAAWAALSYFAGIESGWIAWGIGVLVGFGVVAGGSGHTAGVFTGIMACGIALLSIAGGKYASAHFSVMKYIQDEHLVADDIDDHAIHQYAVDRIAYQQIDDGLPIDWPDSSMTIEFAEWPDDYPAELQSETQAMIEAMSDQQRDDYSLTVVDAQNAKMDAAAPEITADVFAASFSPFDLLFIGLALFSAFKIAGGAEQS